MWWRCSVSWSFLWICAGNQNVALPLCCLATVTTAMYFVPSRPLNLLWVYSRWPKPIPKVCSAMLTLPLTTPLPPSSKATAWVSEASLHLVALPGGSPCKLCQSGWKGPGVNLGNSAMCHFVYILYSSSNVLTVAANIFCWVQCFYLPSAFELFQIAVYS